MEFDESLIEELRKFPNLYMMNNHEDIGETMTLGTDAIRPCSSNNSEKRRGRLTWNDSETRALLTAVEELPVEHSEVFSGRNNLKWRKIAEMVSQATGKDVGREMCRAKWNKLKKSFKDFVQSVKRTGSERREIKFETELRRILTDDPNVTPVCLISEDGDIQGTRRNPPPSEQVTQSQELDTAEEIHNSGMVEETPDIHQARRPTSKKRPHTASDNNARSKKAALIINMKEPEEKRCQDEEKMIFLKKTNEEQSESSAEQLQLMRFIFEELRRLNTLIERVVVAFESQSKK